MSRNDAIPEINQPLAEHLDSVWGDPAVWVANGLHWMHVPAVREQMNEQVTGDPLFSPLEWFFSVVGAQQPLPLGRVLVLGCGQGDVEREMAKQGWVREIVAIDLSAKVLDVARANAEAMGASVEYIQADMNNLPVGQREFEPASFDAVVGVSSVHHCSDLEHLYRSVSTLLAPAGWFYLDEYVGPDRFQYPARQVRVLNQLLDVLPERLRTTFDGRIKGNLRRPTVDEVVAVDPSEAVRSSELLVLLDRYFDIYEHRSYGGALLRVILADIAHNFRDVAAEPYLHGLFQAEDELFRSGRMGRDLACVIARAPLLTNAPSIADC